MIDYPEITEIYLKVKRGGRTLAGKPLDRKGRTMGNWKNGNNKPVDTKLAICMLVTIIKEGEPKDVKMATGALQEIFTEAPYLVEAVLILNPSLHLPALPVPEAPCDPFLELKKTLADELSLPDRYEWIMHIPELSGRRQGQRNDLKVERNPVLEKNISSFSSEVHPNSGEVSDFSGRTDERIAQFLELGKHAVYCLRKVMESQNPVLIGAMREPLLLSPYQVFVLLKFPLTLQKELLEKSKKERNASLRQLKMAEKQGGEKMSP